MFLAKIVRISLIVAIFIVAYLPITINPRIFERNQAPAVSYVAADNIATAIDY